MILQTYDLAQNLKEASEPVIGGFHSPIERECLTILMRGTQPIIICPARSIVGMRVRAEYKQPLEEGRLLILSPFTERQRCTTVQTALYTLEGDANANLVSLGAKLVSPDNPLRS